MGRAMLILLALLSVGWEVGCSHKRGTTLTGAVRYVNIRTEVAPRLLIAQIGDEVRWQNLNQAPVLLRLLEENKPELIACNKGFSQLGVLQDTVTIAPMQYVSLCFSKPTVIRFNVWLDANDPQGAMTPTGSVRIEPARPSRQTL